ncbi:hypothetical protein B0H63DRAFT_461083 [Podospora didyma]|uniref:Spindle pole body protein ppc89 n=1 Tax=Podospora didyma TaxID=330526 RepID=A0AAE0U8L4_9PEZI|nr:hypothetical protein B0H63DRAFT_461083 [Podospora didyma]
MDVNSNKTNIHHNKPKHISRLKKEMLDQRLRHNPFSSPPSSTGSHDTVSTTDEELTRNLSNFSFNPDAEGTRKFDDDNQSLPRRSSTTRSGRFGPRHTTVLNTSVIARTFPEWSGLLGKDTATVSQSIDNGGPFKAIPTIGEGKENVPPEHTQDNTFDDALNFKRKRPRSDMQPRVENESDCSTVLSRTPHRAAQGGRRSRFSNGPVDGIVSSPEPPKRSLQEMVSKIRTEKQTTKSYDSYRDMTPKQPSPPGEASYLHPPNLTLDRSGISPTGRSFFLPAFRHLPDWTSGTLKFSAMKNGVPVFVKSGRAGVQLGPFKSHGAVNAVDMPEDDELIFVSMDKLQEEVRELHDHDAMLQREAEKLQREVNQLQSELKMFKLRKRADSAIGSDSDGSFRRSEAHNQELEDQIAQLQDRLEQASRKVGVHDIHSSALAAERDEALHQAAVARERAKKLQAELEGTQKDLESTLQYRHEKETLELENTSLVANNKTLKQQHEVAIQNNKNLISQCEKLCREVAALEKELAATRDELLSVRKQCEAAEEDKRLMAQDHSSMERSNETYFKENKKLQAQVAARDNHISELNKGISSRDQMLDNIQGLTTDTAIHEMNSELEIELERLKLQLQERDGSISAKEGRIRVLKEQNLELSSAKETLAEENQRLREEYEKMRGQWIDDRHKVIRLNQLLTKNNTEYLKTLNDNTDDCVRLEEEFKQKEAAFREKMDRREAAVRKVKQLTNKITEIYQRDITGKSIKVTRIVEPEEVTGGKYAASDFTGKSSAMEADDDPTTELHLTQGSDFVSIMDNEIIKLKQAYRDGRNPDTETGPAGNTAQVTEYDLPALPVGPGLRRSGSDAGPQTSRQASATQTKGQLAGILKKSSQFALDEDTGRFSVKSALSIGSYHSDEEDDQTAPTTHSHRSAKSISNAQTTEARPESRQRRNSETVHGGVEATVTEQNMTSAFFVPDITLHSDKQGSTGRQTIPSLSKDARRVLDSICKHKSGNCNVCVRVAAYGERRSFSASSSTSRVLVTADDVRKGKKTVSVEKPTPVSDRMPEAINNEEPTMRPSMSPGDALAILIKETQDEIEHIQMELKRLNEVYFGLDKSLGQRERRRIMAEIKRLQADVEAKSGQLYRLHDVLEGQKQAGQLMAEEEIDVTILSGLLRIEATVTSGEGEWNGFD